MCNARWDAGNLWINSSLKCVFGNIKNMKCSCFTFAYVWLCLFVCVQCSVTCGNGTQQRQALCHARDNTIGLCLDSKPDTIRVCRLDPCASEYPTLCSRVDLYPTLWNHKPISVDVKPNKYHNLLYRYHVPAQNWDGRVQCRGGKIQLPPDSNHDLSVTIRFMSRLLIILRFSITITAIFPKNDVVKWV